MKSLLKKVLILVIALSCVLCSFVGCGPDDEEEQIDESRTQVYVTLRNDGLGVDWMKKDMKEAYEKLHPEIQIMVDTNYRDSTLADMPSNKNQIFFNARDSYMQFAASGNLANIKDWVTEKVYDENYNYVGTGGSVSIVDRMPANFAKLYNVNGGYYGTPFYEGTFGIWYDYDLVGPDGLNLLVYGNGPDGVANTPDDGLPRNFTEFKKFVKAIRDRNYIPFSMSTIDYVRNGLLDAFYANYEGKNDFDINFSFNGTLQTPVKDDLGNDVYQINANQGTANFKYLTKQKGRLAALAMINEIVDVKNMTAASYKGQGHTDAQSEFVYSITKESENKRVAMFMEGAYWHNEARPTFDAMGLKDASHAYGQREFRYLALPKFAEGEVEGLPASKNTGRTTMFSTGSDAFVFVNKKAENLKEVKEFYQWLNGNEGCYYFTKGSCTFRTIATKFTEDQINSLAKVTQNLYAYRYAENTDMCYELSTSKTRYDQYSTFLQFDDLSTVANADENDPWAYLKDHPGNIQTFYEGYYTYWGPKSDSVSHLG